MWLVLSAMRRPITILVLVLSIALAATLAIRRMKVDIFPNLGAPAIFVAQPYSGMDPSQMEGFLTYYYEYHFLYVTGIEHVESRNIQGASLMKLVFHEGTDMSQAMAQVVGNVNRARAFMPPGRCAAVHRALRRRQRAGRPVDLLQPHPRPRRNAEHRAQPGAPALRHPARRLRSSALRRQPAHHRHPAQSGASPGLSHLARRSHRGGQSRLPGHALR